VVAVLFLDVVVIFGVGDVLVVMTDEFYDNLADLSLFLVDGIS
jgi:hypothetical protein